MSAKGYVVAEEAHVVSAIPPIDANDGAITGERFHLKNHAHCSIILTYGVTGAATTVVLEESTNIGGDNNTAIAFSVYKEETAAGDTLGVRTAVGTGGLTSSTNDGLIYVIEVDASQLSDTKPYIGLTVTDPGSATLVSAVAILSGSRYAQESSATAIT